MKEVMFRFILFLSGCVIAPFAEIIGGNKMMLIIVFCAVLLDFISALILAFEQGKLNSTIGRKGMAGKLMYVVIISSFMLLELLGEQIGYSLGFTLTGVCVAITIIEIISIFENSLQMTYISQKAPRFLFDAIDVLRKIERGQQNDKNNND